MSVLLQAENLSFSYGRQRILQNIDFFAEEGELISIIGANGAGKSTLLKLMAGYEKPDSGRIAYRGKDLHAISIPKRAKEITILYQNGGIPFPFTCMELVWMGRYPISGRFDKKDEEAVRRILSLMEQTECLHLADKKIQEISGGEFQKVMLARALAQEPKLLLLDEAMSDFDVAVKIKMSKLLRELTKTGLTIIMVNHDIAAACRFSHRIIALQDGSIAADGKPEEVMTEALLETVFGVKGEVVNGKGIFLYDNIE